MLSLLNGMLLLVCLPAISGSYPKATTTGSHNGSAIPVLVTANRPRRDNNDTFLPPLLNGSKMGTAPTHHSSSNNNTSHSPSSSDRMSATPPEPVVRSNKGSAMLSSRRGSPTHFAQYGYYHQNHQYFPPLNSATPLSSAVPKTTKYSDFRKARAGMPNGDLNNPQPQPRPMMRMKSSSEENLDERSTSPTTRYFIERAAGDGYGGGGGGMRPPRKPITNLSNSSTNIHYPLSY